MRKARILSGLLVVVMVLSMLTTSVFAVDSEKEVLSDVPYDYGVVPFSEEYRGLTFEKQKDIYSISEEVAKGLTTEALLETILSNPFLIDFFLYDNFSEALNAKNKEFQIFELLNRPNINNVLLEYKNIYSNILNNNNNKNRYSIMRQLENNSLFLSSYEIETAYNNLRYDFIIKLLEHNLIIQNNNNTLESRYVKDCVYTKRLVEVTCFFYYTWEDHNETETSADNKAILNYTVYSPFGARVVQGKDPSYNCHSYAWHSTDYTSNSAWIERIYMAPYLREAVRVYGNNIQVGTKVCYFDSDGVLKHSGIVNELNSDGTVKNVASKWGFTQLMLHPLKVGPYPTNDIRYYNY